MSATPPTGSTPLDGGTPAVPPTPSPRTSVRRTKFRLAVTAVVSLALLYTALNVGLLLLARHVEAASAVNVYPFASEDWLRCLLPSLYDDRGRGRVFLAGPSEAREDLLYDRFDRAFPGLSTFQGAQSLGTFDDLLLTLDYVKRTCGDDAMPRVMVLGITPRFVANIPRGGSPLAKAIDAYSPRFSVEKGDGVSQLVPKPVLSGLRSRQRFLAKAPDRYRSALLTLFRKPLGLDKDYEQVHEHLLHAPLGAEIRFWSLPYKYHHLPPMPRDQMRSWMNSPTSFWTMSHEWDPAPDARLVGAQFERLLDLTRQHDVRLFVVNLPEHPDNRAGYDPARYGAYLRIVRDSIGTTPFLDLRTLLADEEFYDVGHANLPGAVRVTDEVIRFMKAADPASAVTE
jgi:hypothetical protein